MFSYVMLGTDDLPRAVRFYDPLMELPGHPKAGRSEEGASWGTFNGNGTTGLSACPLTGSLPVSGMARWWL